MPRTAKIFLASVVVAAAAASLSFSVRGLSDRPDLLFPLLLAGFLAGVGRVRFPDHGTQMSAADAFVFCALAALGPMAACLVAALTVGGATLARGRNLKGAQVLFNLAGVLLSVAAAAGAFAFAGGSPGSGSTQHVGPLAAAVLVYFVVNSCLVAGIIALVRRTSFRSTWWRAFGRTPPMYLGGYAMAVAMLAVLDAGVIWGIAFGIVPFWLMLALLRSHSRAIEAAGMPRLA